jgi:hypothetical protein
MVTISRSSFWMTAVSMVTLIASKTGIDIIYFCLVNSRRRNVNYSLFARRTPKKRIYMAGCVCLTVCFNSRIIKRYLIKFGVDIMPFETTQNS